MQVGTYCIHYCIVCETFKMSEYVDTVIILFVYRIMHIHLKTFWTPCICKPDRLSLWLSIIFIIFLLIMVTGKLSENKEKKIAF